MSEPLCSVIVLPGADTEAVVRLRDDLGRQILPASRFEVLVADGGRDGAFAASDAVRSARAPLVVLLHGSMRVGPEFLELHVSAHDGEPAIVVGPTRLAPGRVRAPHADQRLATPEGRSGDASLDGDQVPSVNVSLRRADYLAAERTAPAGPVGPCMEIGRYLEETGVRLTWCPGAVAYWDDGRESIGEWRQAAQSAGRARFRRACANVERPELSPWHELFVRSATSRWLVLWTLRSPRAGRLATSVLLGAARGAMTMRMRRIAAGCTALAQRLEEAQGAREEAGGTAGALASLDDYLNRRGPEGLGLRGRLMQFRAAVRADHRALSSADARYAAASQRRGGGILSTMVQRIGFQMMVAYRVMRLVRGSQGGLLARLVSRWMRHLYAADIHWDAELAPGVIIVHGTGLVISHAARVGPRCILFQHVTLGVNIDPASRESGAPTLERDVHVGPGAVVLGPIVVGHGTKIMANALLMRSTPPHARVETAESVVRVRQPPASDAAAMAQRTPA